MQAIKQEPKIILLGGCGLAFGAAFANTGLLLYTGTSVSHLTGDISRITIDVAHYTAAINSELTRVIVAALCFLLGAILSGILIHHPTLDISRPYGRSITGIGFLLLLAHLFMPVYPSASIALAAFACGLQNALATHYRGLILRTTHLTGIITDLGVNLGMRLRGYDIPLWKIAVPAMLCASFTMGGILGAYLHFGDQQTILLCSMGYILAGTSWTLWKHRHIFQALKKR